jgi:hypothetical protein
MTARLRNAEHRDTLEACDIPFYPIGQQSSRAARPASTIGPWPACITPVLQGTACLITELTSFSEVVDQWTVNTSLFKCSGG